MSDVIKMLEAAARARPLNRAQLQLVRQHMTAASVRTICIDGVLFERVDSGLQLRRLPPRRAPIDRPATEQESHG